MRRATGGESRIDPDSFYIEYTYDDANRMDLVKENGSQILADYGYDTLSRRTSLVRANGDTTNLGYEPDSDLSSITHVGLPTAPAFGFLRNAAHQITTLTVSDPALVAVPTPGPPTVYVPNALNEYGSVGGTTYAHDSKGNLVNDGQTAFTYDAENRLFTAIRAGVTTTYAYDGLGRRIFQGVGTGQNAVPAGR